VGQEVKRLNAHRGHGREVADLEQTLAGATAEHTAAALAHAHLDVG
jgi:hypothetical protein